jgi:hypothetical protein
MIRPSAVLLAGLCAAVSCGDGKSIGPADSYALFAPAKKAAATPSGLPVLRVLNIRDEDAQPLVTLFAEGFASEMVRTAYMVKQLVREGRPLGRPFPEAGRALAAEAIPVVVGLDRSPYGRGLALEPWLGAPIERPEMVWLGLSGNLVGDKALVQTVTARLATYCLHFALTGGTFADPAAAAPPALADGYRMAMEVVAREWRVGKGPQGVVPYDAGTLAQRKLFGNIRENRFVLAEDGRTVRPGAELLAEPGVAATVIYRLAQAKPIANRVAPEGFYAPFASNRLPPGVSPAAVLGAFRNFQLKLLGSWAEAVQGGRPPRDIGELIEVYVAAFPAEKAEVLRIFVVTTFGGTVQAGGVSTRAEDASKALAAIDALVGDVSAGRRSLRAAAGPR